MPGRNTGKNRATPGNRPARRAGPRFRRGPNNVLVDQLEADGIRLDPKYRALGPRNRANVVRAIREGFVYAGTSGTTEEQCCYGELRRRGFEVGENGSRSFVTQFPIAGSVVDFAVWFTGERVVIRPNNRYWHGHAVELRDLEQGAEDIEQAGWTVYDIWDGDSLSDAGIEARFNLFFGV